MVKGNITKSAGFYTVSVFVDGVRNYKESGIYSLQDAQEIMAYQKKVISQNLDIRRSFPELEGKVCTGLFSNGRDDIRVVGCDYWIGVTLCFNNNPKEYVLCLRGPGSALGRKILNNNPTNFDNYDDLFLMVINMIRSGIVAIQDIVNFEVANSDGPGKNPNSKNCAFNS